MADPFIAEIRIFAGNFAPVNWAACSGQLMRITQNTQLFSLIGTYYGGDGKVTFALPDMRDATPIGQGLGPGLTQRDVGESGGEKAVTLTVPEMAAHNHAFGGTNNTGDQVAPAPDRVLAQSTPAQAYQTDTTNNMKPFAPAMLGMAGRGLAHNNVMPSLAATFIIALQGTFPPRS